jgi:WD40 repeat protein
VVTGSVGGNLYVWKDNTKPIKGHEGKVTSLVFDKQNLYSAGLDGKVIVWNQQQGLLT